MKRIFTFVSALFLLNATYGQQLLKNSSNAHHRVLRSLLQNNRSYETAERSTSGTASERVIAISTRDNTAGTLTDSVNLRYGTYRGSQYDYNDLLYAYNYPYASSPMFNYAGVYTKPQVLFDTMMHWEVDPNTLVYGYYETGYCSYDAASNITNYKNLFADSSIYPNMIYKNTFTGANNINAGYWFRFQSGISDSSFKQFFSYNSSNKLVEDSTYELHLGTWRIVSRSYYTYDASNNLIQIDNYANTTDTSFLLPLPEQLKYVNTYDASNRLQTVLGYSYNGTSLIQDVKDTFAYTGTHTYHTAWREYQWDAINHYWAPMFNMTKTINGLGLPDTTLVRSFDSLSNSWVPHTMDVMHYNTFPDPDTLKDYEYNFSYYPATPNYTTIYYYQPYINALYENKVNIAPAFLKAYPNPSSGFIRLSCTALKESEPVTLSAVNEGGQLVSRLTMPWHEGCEMSLTGLVAGTYWIILQDSGGRNVGKAQITKL